MFSRMPHLSASFAVVVRRYPSSLNARATTGSSLFRCSLRRLGLGMRISAVSLLLSCFDIVSNYLHNTSSESFVKSLWPAWRALSSLDLENAPLQLGVQLDLLQNPDYPHPGARVGKGERFGQKNALHFAVALVIDRDEVRGIRDRNACPLDPEGPLLKSPLDGVPGRRDRMNEDLAPLTSHDFSARFGQEPRQEHGLAQHLKRSEARVDSSKVRRLTFLPLEAIFSSEK